MKEKINQSDINSLIETIQKIEKKLVFSRIGIFIGIFIILLSFISIMMQGSDILVGFFCLAGIGLFVIVLNYISLKDRKKRIEELKIDLKKMKEAYNSQVEI